MAIVIPASAPKHEPRHAAGRPRRPSAQRPCLQLVGSELAIPGATCPSLAPRGRTARWIASENSAARPIPESWRTRTASKRSRSCLTIRDAETWTPARARHPRAATRVARRQDAHERADHHRVECLGAQEPPPAQEDLRDQRLSRLAKHQDLHRQLTVSGLQRAPEQAAPPARHRLEPALAARTTQPHVKNSSSTARRHSTDREARRGKQAPSERDATARRTESIAVAPSWR